MSKTPHIDQLQRVSKFIKSLEDYDLFLSHVGENVNSLGEIRSSAFHSRLSQLSQLENKIIQAGMDQLDYDGLMCEIRAYQFCIRLETLKATFANMLKDTIASSNDLQDPDFTLDNYTLGTLIWKINDVVCPLDNGLDERVREQRKVQRKDNQELFFKTFRDSIIHRDFELIGANLVYGDEHNPQTWNGQTAQTMSDELTTLEVMINEKLNELQQAPRSTD